MAKDDASLRGIAKVKALEGAITKLTQTISETFQDFTKFERSAAGLGMDYDIASQRLAGSMEGLRGDITERLTTALTATQAGLFGNTQGINKLINQQRLTGVNAVKSAKAIAALENELGMSREATNALAPQIVELSKAYTISTDTLVNSIGGLSNRFGTLNLAGIGDEFAGTMATLQAQFGQANEKLLNRFVSGFLDPTSETFSKLSAMGLGDSRERFLAATTQAQQVAILKDVIQKAGAFASDFTAGSENFYLMTGILEENFGMLPTIGKQLSDVMDKGLRNEQDVTQDFFNQIKNLSKEAISPLKELFFELIADIKPLLPELSAFVKEGLQAFADSIRATIDSFGGLRPAMMALKEFIKDKLGFAKAAGGILSFIVQVKLASMALSPFKKLGGAALRLGGILFSAAKSGRLLATIFSGLRVILGIFGGPVTAVIAGLTILQAKFNIFGKAIDYVKGLLGFGGGDDVAESVREGHNITNEHLGNINVRHNELNEYARRSAEANERIAGETTETRTSRFLNDTQDTLSRAVEAIIGVRGDSSVEELVELMRDQNEMIATSPMGARATFVPQDGGSNR